MSYPTAVSGRLAARGPVSAEHRLRQRGGSRLVPPRYGGRPRGPPSADQEPDGPRLPLASLRGVPGRVCESEDRFSADQGLGPGDACMRGAAHSEALCRSQGAQCPHRLYR